MQEVEWEHEQLARRPGSLLFISNKSTIPFVLWRAFAPGLHERRAAIIADERLGLNARLSSALSLDFSDPINAPFGGAFLNEATHKMSVVKVHEAFPLRVPRAFGWLLA